MNDTINTSTWTRDRLSNSLACAGNAGLILLMQDMVQLGKGESAVEAVRDDKVLTEEQAMALIAVYSLRCAIALGTEALRTFTTDGPPIEDGHAAQVFMTRSGLWDDRPGMDEREEDLFGKLVAFLGTKGHGPCADPA